MHHPVVPRAVWRPSTGRLVVAGLWVLLAWLAFAGAAAAASALADGTVVLTEARAAAGGSASFPNGAPTTALSLPAHSRRLPLDADGSLWLRLVFDRPAGVPAGTLLSVHLPSSCGWLDVDLNGQPVQRDTDHPGEATSVCPRPRLVALPTALLRARGNQLDLRLRGPMPDSVTSPRRAPALSEVIVGPSSVLAEAQAGAGFWQLTAVRALHIVVAMLGAFMLLLAVGQRRTDHLAWFGLTSLGWAALLTPVWWMTLPLASPTLELLLASLLAPVTACAIHFLAGVGPWRLPSRAMAVLWAQCVLLPLSLVMFAESQRSAVTMFWWCVLGAELAAALTTHVVVCWRERQPAAVMALGILGFGLLAWALDATQIPAGLPWTGQLAWMIPSPYGWSMLLIATGLRLMQLFNRTLQEAEANRLDLEGQVRAITAEIEHNFAQLAEMRVEQITEQERKRIAADLHDDLGAKLLTIVHTCDNERIAALGREALDEMRLSVRGLSGKPVRLLDAMADWRAETVQRLAQTHIQVEWENPADDNDSLLPARAFVQTTRILREAVSNIIKHSGASRCEVRCYAGDAGYGVVLEDNGRGIPLDFDNAADNGHGMTTMKHRAKQLNGQCLVESGPGLGTVIRLSLPL